MRGLQYEKEYPVVAGAGARMNYHNSSHALPGVLPDVLWKMLRYPSIDAPQKAKRLTAFHAIHRSICLEEDEVTAT